MKPVSSSNSSPIWPTSIEPVKVVPSAIIRRSGRAGRRCLERADGRTSVHVGRGTVCNATGSLRESEMVRNGIMMPEGAIRLAEPFRMRACPLLGLEAAKDRYCPGRRRRRQRPRPASRPAALCPARDRVGLDDRNRPGLTTDLRNRLPAIQLLSTPSFRETH